jgi:cytoskeletal protein CcmA (bactofilin family)
MVMRKKRYWALLALLASFGLLALLLATPAQAADFRSGDRVVIGADEVIDDDLFIGGNVIEVNGTVTGDLFATGTEVSVNGQVGGSVFLAGQSLQVNGDVQGSVYSAGYSLAIGPEAAIGRNVFFAGFSLSAAEGSTIGRSLYSSSYQTIVDGDVSGDVSVSGGALEVNGSVGGDVTGEVADAQGSTAPQFVFPFPGAVDMVDPGLRISEGAEIGGDVDVKETTQAGFDVSPPDVGSLVVGGLTRSLASRVGEFIALLIVGGLLLWLWPAAAERLRRTTGEKPLASAGSGCLLLIAFAIGVPLACLVTGGVAAFGGLITLGQLGGSILSVSWAAIGLFVAVFMFVLTLVAKVIVAFWAGRSLLDRLAPDRQPGYWAGFSSLALGAFIYEVLRFIPVLGWIVAVIVTLVGLGAIYFVLRDTLRPPPSEEMPPEPPGTDEAMQLKKA